MPIKTAEEAKELVDKLGKSFYNSAREITKDLDDKERWIVMARTINGLFASIFGPSYNLAIKTVNEEIEKKFGKEIM